MAETYEDYEKVSDFSRTFVKAETDDGNLLAAYRIVFLLFSSQEYNSYLSRVRSFLAGNRSKTTLRECERLLGEAKKCATAMQGLAEVEGNQMKIREASQRVERDIAPLTKEIQRSNEGNREELFYQAPSAASGQTGDMESLIAGSEDLLRESQA